MVETQQKEVSGSC